MDVQVLVPATLRALAGGRPTLEVDLPDNATIADLLDVLGVGHPALARRVRDEQGRLRVHVNLFVGDTNVRALSGTATPLRAGDEVSILAAISGG